MENQIKDRIEFITLRINLLNANLENKLSKSDKAIHEARLDTLLSERHFLQKLLENII